MIKCLKSVSANVIWNILKAKLYQQLSENPLSVHMTTQLINKEQTKGESLQEFIFEFGNLIYFVTGHTPDQVPFKITLLV